MSVINSGSEAELRVPLRTVHRQRLDEVGIMLGTKRIVVAVVVVLLGVILPIVPAAAQLSVIVGQTELSWSGDWQLDEASSMQQQATLTQGDSVSGSIKLATYGEFWDNSVGSPGAALDTFATAFFEGAGATAVLEQEAGQLDTGAVWKLYTFDLQGLDLSFLTVVLHRSDGAFIVSTLTGNTDQFATTIQQAQQEITLNGTPTFLEDIDAVVVTESSPAADTETGSGGLNTGASGGASLPSSLDRPAPSSQELEILGVSMKDAGIGDGSVYVYVEVVNNTTKLYSYVGVEGTCRDASGGILGTGIGNTMNVAPGETVVITMIVLGVPGCTDVDVRFDGLTGMV